MTENLNTPLRKKQKRNLTVQIPPSPLMKKIGFGTGIAVYEFQRSPIPNKVHSPWAVKKLINKPKNKETKCINERLKAEAAILCRLNHPNIIGFRAFVQEAKGANVLAMEECSGCLGDLIENRLCSLGQVPYPSDIILKVSSDVAKALEYLHNTALILHCDIKSYNILIKGEFQVCKLCDFGVCLPLTKSGEVDKSKTGDEVEYVGTPSWCAPEILQCNQQITTKADIYSFGLVIWEMLALSPPIDEELMESFEETSLIELTSINIVTELETVRQRPALPDVELGSEYNLILEMYFCCTVADMTKRPSAEDLAVVLNEILNQI